MASSLLQDSRSSALTAIGGRKESFQEISSIDQQSAFYSYFNQASTMQMFAPQLFAHQTMMSSWPFHPTLFSGWPLAATLPYTSPSAAFTLSSPSTINNNYPSEVDTNSDEKDDIKRSNYSIYSGSISPASQMNDSVEIKKFSEKKDSAKKIFECKVCNKTFGYKHVLQNHEKVHTGEKSYRCSKCNKCFRRDHHLKVHMRLHSGEKPYVCSFPTCDRQFVQVANLRRHLKTHEHANHLQIHEKLLQTEEQISQQSYVQETSEDSLDLRKVSSTEKINKFDYAPFDMTFKPSMDLKYESPEQSEPEDLSTRALSRMKGKHN